MTAFIFLLGAIIIITVQMAGAVLYMTAVMPSKGFLKVLARYLRHGKEEEAVDFFPPFETMTRLLKIRRRAVYGIVAALAAGSAASAACGFYSPGALVYVVPSFLVAELVLLIGTGVLTAWVRRCRSIHDTDWAEEEPG